MNKKLTIEAYKSIQFGAGDKLGELTLQINPETYTLNRSINYATERRDNSNALQPVYKQTKPSTLTFSAFFDGTGIIPTGGKKVKDRVKELENLVYLGNTDVNDNPKAKKPLPQPCYLKVTWGSLSFQGRLNSLNWTYSLFAPSGEPIRAKASLSLTEAIATLETQKKIESEKPQGKNIIFRKGDSLTGLCAKEYKNSGYAAMIASINNLISFRDIKPGTPLWFPKL